MPSAPAASTIASLFEARVILDPEAPALTLDGQSLTYAQLNTRANQLAHRLRAIGIGPESLVAIHLDRGFDLIVAIFAILKAGGAYLPLDLACPEDRIAFQLTDARAAAAITRSSLASRLAASPGPVISLDAEAGSLAAAPADNLPLTSGPDHLAYVIYTSGSTGTPKGVLVTQRNVVRLFTVTEPLYRFGPTDVWTLFHSSAFDFSVWEIFGALLYGGRLVVVPYMVSRSAAAFRDLIAREAVTVLNQTPSAFRQLIQADRAVAPLSPMPLRHVIFGGEALEFESLRPWFERYGDQRPQCVNMYGITETTVHVTHRPVSMADLGGSASNIGRAIPDLQVYLADDALRPVPAGQPGEMLIGGPGVARGYLNRPDLTAQRFIPDSFGPSAGLLYRSGDLARLNPAGEFEYLGRIDHQVKIRGFRIELPEIEAALTRHPSIAECAVLARADDGADPRLAAYFVPVPGAAPDTASLRAHLAQTLPDYMVPAVFMPLLAFPLTVNGKLDRAALPAPGPARPQLSTAYAEPASPLQQNVATAWRISLRQQEVGIDDNFFDLGGDSLLLIAVHMRLQKDLGRDIPITALFQFPTIRTLAAHLSTSSGAQSASLGASAALRAQRQREALMRPRANAARSPLPRTREG